MRYDRPRDQRKRRAARQPLDDRSAGYTGVMTADAQHAAEEPIPLPTVKAIHDNIVKVANMVGELKADVATKDDIAAVNARLDKLATGFNAVVEALTAIGKWVQDTESRLTRIDGRLDRIENHLGVPDE